MLKNRSLTLAWNLGPVWKLFLNIVSNSENKFGNLLTENNFLRICSENCFFFKTKFSPLKSFAFYLSAYYPHEKQAKKTVFHIKSQIEFIFLKTIENCVLRIILKNCFLKIILKNHFLITVLKDIPKYAMGHAWKLFLKTVFCSLKQ